jgi:hypothetical protein
MRFLLLRVGSDGPYFFMIADSSMICILLAYRKRFNLAVAANTASRTKTMKTPHGLISPLAKVLTDPTFIKRLARWPQTAIAARCLCCSAPRTASRSTLTHAVGPTPIWQQRRNRQLPRHDLVSAVI